MRLALSAPERSADKQTVKRLAVKGNKRIKIGVAVNGFCGADYKQDYYKAGNKAPEFENCREYQKQCS